MKKLIALLLTLLMCLSLFACGKDEGTPDTTGTSNSTTESTSNEQSSSPEGNKPEATPRPDIQMSDKVDNFTVIIDGLVYQLGCSVEVFLNDGWIPESGYVLEEDYTVPSGETRGVVFYKGDKDKTISVKSYYPAEEASAYREGIVLGIHSESGSTADVELAGGLILNESLTLQDVINVFGNDYTYSKFNGDRYVYRFESKGLYIFTFEDDHLTYWEFRVYEDTVK